MSWITCGNWKGRVRYRVHEDRLGGSRQSLCMRLFHVGLLSSAPLIVTLNHLGFGAIYVYNPLHIPLQYIVCENLTLLHACLNFLSVLL